MHSTYENKRPLSSSTSVTRHYSTHLHSSTLNNLDFKPRTPLKTLNPQPPTPSNPTRRPTSATPIGKPPTSNNYLKTPTYKSSDLSKFTSPPPQQPLQTLPSPPRPRPPPNLTHNISGSYLSSRPNFSTQKIYPSSLTSRLNGKIFWEQAFVFLYRMKCFPKICRILYFPKNRPILPPNFGLHFFEVEKLGKSLGKVKFLKIFLEEET